CDLRILLGENGPDRMDYQEQNRETGGKIESQEYGPANPRCILPFSNHGAGFSICRCFFSFACNVNRSRCSMESRAIGAVRAASANREDLSRIATRSAAAVDRPVMTTSWSCLCPISERRNSVSQESRGSIRDTSSQTSSSPGAS